MTEPDGPIEPAGAGRRPRAVTIAVVIFYVLGTLGVIGGVLTLGLEDSVFEEADVDPGAARAQAVVNLVISAVQLVVATLLLRGNRIARTVGTGLAGLTVAFGILSLPTGVLSLVLGGIVIYLLQFAPETKAYFD